MLLELFQTEWAWFRCRFRLCAIRGGPAFLLAGLIVLSDPASSAEMKPIRPAQVTALFNGTNLAGWYSWLVDSHRADPRGVFAVTDGAIRISGEGLGYLATENEFRDYHLVVEFKWGRTNWNWGGRVGKARDSGLFLHSIGPDGNSYDGNGAFRAAVECQIMQGSVGDFLLIRGRAGDGSMIAPRVSVEAAPARDADGWPFWKPGTARVHLERWGRVNWFAKSTNWTDRIDFRGRDDVDSPPGDWTRVECLCKGDSISVAVNGTKVNEVSSGHPAAGRILLQCEGSEIYFRRVELRPLPDDSPPAP